MTSNLSTWKDQRVDGSPSYGAPDQCSSGLRQRSTSDCTGDRRRRLTRSQFRERNDVTGRPYGSLSNSKGTGQERMLMREWLECQANSGCVPGLKWLDKSRGLVAISWKHGSKSGWLASDGQVFESWARYTGRFTLTNHLPRKWKANFRCAIKSLTDVVAVPEMDSKNDPDPYKVYRLLTETPRKRQRRHSQILLEATICKGDTTSSETAFGQLTMNRGSKGEDDSEITDDSQVNKMSGVHNPITDSVEHYSTTVCNHNVLIPTTVEELLTDVDDCDESDVTTNISSVDETDMNNITTGNADCHGPEAEAYSVDTENSDPPQNVTMSMNDDVESISSQQQKDSCLAISNALVGDWFDIRILSSEDLFEDHLELVDFITR